ncbi:MAG: acetylglucosamine-6-sulfatase, partial [Synechococcus sp. NP17]|nr:acetylglucosamine-6-sulfatase [Synechococcus sp. NP17]
MYCLRCIAISIVLLATTGRAADRPNILYIMSDDHAAHAISAYKGRLAEIAPTPNLDRIAHEGALFS